MYRIFSFYVVLFLVFGISASILGNDDKLEKEKIKAQIEEVYKEAKEVLKIQMKLCRDDKSILEETLVLYKNNSEKLGVTQSDFDDIEIRICAIEVALPLYESIVENYDEIISPVMDDPVNYNQEFLDYLKDQLQDEKDKITKFKKKYLEPGKKHLKEIKEELKE